MYPADTQTFTKTYDESQPQRLRDKLLALPAREEFLEWGYNSGAENLPSVCEDLGSTVGVRRWSLPEMYLSYLYNALKIYFIGFHCPLVLFFNVY